MNPFDWLTIYVRRQILKDRLKDGAKKLRIRIHGIGSRGVLDVELKDILRIVLGVQSIRFWRVSGFECMLNSGAPDTALALFSRLDDAFEVENISSDELTDIAYHIMQTIDGTFRGYLTSGNDSNTDDFVTEILFFDSSFVELESSNPEIVRAIADHYKNVTVIN